MKRFSKYIVAGVISTGMLCLGYVSHAEPERTGGPTATAVIHNAANHEGKITGTVTFKSEADGVRVVAAVDGLSPGVHGFHIHEKADVSAPDLMSAGGHWNPGGHKHGGPESEEHHAGDLGNLTADDKGHAHLDQLFKGLTIEGKMGVVAHSVIIHEKADDLTSQPAGDAGKRIAGGAIVLGTPPK
jgi:Cu-Zn family superoxide dismutase